MEKKKLSLGDQGSVISEDTAKESHVEGKDGDNENHKAVRKARVRTIFSTESQIKGIDPP